MRKRRSGGNHRSEKVFPDHKATRRLANEPIKKGSTGKKKDLQTAKGHISREGCETSYLKIEPEAVLLR